MAEAPGGVAVVAARLTRVLVAESRAIRATAIAGLVAEAGHVVLGVESSIGSARSAMLALRPDVVLLGLDDASHAWLDVLQELAADRTAAVAYTQHLRDRHLHVEALRHGARAVVRPPVDPAQVARAVAAGLVGPLRRLPSTVLVAVGTVDQRGELTSHRPGLLARDEARRIVVRLDTSDLTPGEELVIDEIPMMPGSVGQLLVHDVRSGPGGIGVVHADWVGIAPSRITAQLGGARPLPTAPLTPPAPTPTVTPPPRAAAEGRPEEGAGTSASSSGAAILRAFPGLALATGSNSEIVEASERLARLVGRPVDDLVGQPLTAVVVAAANATALRHADGERTSVRMEFEHLELGGQPLTIWSFEPRAHPQDVDAGERWAQTARERIELRFNDLFDHLVVPIVRLDAAGHAVSANPAFAELLGYDGPGQLLVASVEPLDASLGDAVRHLVLAGTDASTDPRLEVRFRRRDGGTVAALVRVRRLSGMSAAEGTVELTVVDDAAAEPKDALDALPRSQAFEDALARTQGEVTLVLVDVDLLADVNDAFGYHVGDEALSTIARRLASSVHAGDLLARLGGDEFAVVCRHGRLEGEGMARRIHEAVRMPFDVGGSPHTCTASLGVATLDDGALSPVDLGRRAATALREAKHRGRDQLRIADGAPGPIPIPPGLTVAQLRRALTDDTLSAVYQPIRSLADGGVVGQEAFIRWQHPERGVLGPAQFLHVADRSGLIVEIGACTLRLACEHLAEQTAGTTGAARPGPRQVTVNLSLRQVVDDGFVALVERTATEVGIAPDRVVFDIVATPRLADDRDVRRTLQELAALGCGIVLERFGSGHAPFELVRTLPLTGVKVGGHLVRDLPGDARAAVVLRGAVRMAGDLGLPVGVVGVERREQLEAARDAGCQTVQGSLFGGPAADDV
jgi:diguanylate cyclase (GGDEF)-like protein/PAS domain S-box-containing protein